MRVDDGVLFFPVTPFDGEGEFAPDAFRAHLADGLRFEPGGVFAACGTGEYFSLDEDEYRSVVRIAVEEAAGRVDVAAGAGGPTRRAIRDARAAIEEGATTILAMPPYLVRGSQAGLVDHFTRIADAVDADVIVYHRDNAVLSPESVRQLARHPRVVGLKDGHGDVGLLERIVATVDESDFVYFNGMPTAELYARAFRGVGVRAYSSAVFCFAPEIAVAFHRALATGDEETIALLLRDFFVPLVEIRDRAPGYAVALVKAGVALRGIDAGGVRPPLRDADPDDLADLSRLVDRARATAGV
ncbi:5-dehydro-4-deoxyglucarate dehydratase [Homoserinibacter sp. GY 40078]|nr:5-dehydro-4-deoxyglucarate dehydratase [Homoserinibacter sp. GY 40078]